MKVLKIILSLLLLNSFTSCVITEKINFNEDHSGKLVYDMDMSQIMEMARDKVGGADSKKSKNKKGAFDRTEMDSTFTFKELFKEKQDSINSLPEEERLKLKQMENYTMRMLMSERNKQFKYIISTDFNSPTELQNLVSPMNAASQFNQMGSQLTKDSPKNEGITKYSFDGKTFSKLVSLSPNALLMKGLKKGLNKEASEAEESEDDLSEKMDETMKMVFEQSKYYMEVSFPKKIKSISIPNAVISDDKKSVVLTFSMNDYMESKNLNFEVELE